MHGYLTFDVGTTAVKSCLFDDDLRLLSIANEEYTLDTDAGGRVELDPERYWQAVCGGAAEALRRAQLPPSAVSAICITTQGETLIPIGKDGHALRKAIVWLDERAKKQADTLSARFSSAEFYHETGLPELNGFLPLAKLMWIRENEPEIYRQTEKFLLLEDYLLYRLTGQLAAEKTLASSTGWFSLRTDGYWQEGLAAAGIPQEKLPELFEPGTALSAKLLPDVREKLGFRADTCVVTGTMDQTAGALGAGNLRPGCVTETTGTALCIGAALEKADLDDPNRVTVYRHVKPGLFLMLPFCMTAGLFLKWFKDTFCEAECRQAEQEHRSVYELLDELAEQTPPGAGGLLALPYLTGSIQPCSNPNARGVFFGIGLDTKKQHFLRAVYESVAFMLRENLELLTRVNHMPVTQIRSLGGGAKSAVWRQIKADVTGIPVGLAVQSESTSLGAAMLASVACGGKASLEQAAQAADRAVVWTKPDRAGRYEQAYQKYCELFRTLNPLF